MITKITKQMTMILLVLVVALVGCQNPQPTRSPISPLEVAAIKTPTPRPTAVVPGNLLENPSFEGDYINCGESCNVAPGWSPWTSQTINPPCVAGQAGCYIPCPSNCDNCRRDYGCWWSKAEHKAVTLQFPENVRTGERAQQAFTYGRMGEFGVYQVVVVPVGARLRFSGYAGAWICSTYPNCDGSGEMITRVGIDPFGDADPYSGDVVWGSPITITRFRQFNLLSVETVAQADQVTVFTYARPLWMWSHENNDVYWDDAALVAEVQTPTMTPAPTINPTRLTDHVGLPMVQRGYAAPTPRPTATRTPGPTATRAPYSQPYVYVDDVALAAGETVSVPVYLLNDPGVNGLELEFYYDQGVINIDGIAAGGAVPLREFGVGEKKLFVEFEREWTLSQPEPAPALSNSAPGNMLAYLTITGIARGTTAIEPVQSGTPVALFGTQWDCPAGAFQATSIRAWKVGGGMWNPCARIAVVVVR